MSKRWDKYLFQWDIEMTHSMGFCFFGAGNSAIRFMSMFPKVKPKLIIDNNPALWGKKISGIEIFSPDQLLLFPSDELIVVITSDYRNEIERQLFEMGYYLPQHRLAGRPAPIHFDDVWPLFFRSFEDAYQSVRSINRRGGRVILLRDFKGIDDFIPGDLDVLSTREAYSELLKLSSGNKYFAGAYRLDCVIYERNNMPYMPLKIKQLLWNNAQYLNGIFVPEPPAFTSSFVYHIALRKSPLWTGIDSSDASVLETTKYTEQLIPDLHFIGISHDELNQEALFSYLHSNDLLPDRTNFEKIATAQRNSMQSHDVLYKWAWGSDVTANDRSY